MAEIDPGAPCATTAGDDAQADGGGALIAHASDGWGIAGFGLYLAWVYLIMTCSVTGDARIPQITATLLVAAFLIGEAAAAAVVASGAARLTGRRVIRVISGVSCALLVLPGLAALVPVSETVLFAACWRILPSSSPS